MSKPSLALVTSKMKVDGVSCDICGCRELVAQDGTTGIRVLRTKLREAGWLCRDDMDVCPDDRPPVPGGHHG